MSSSNSVLVNVAKQFSSVASGLALAGLLLVANAYGASPYWYFGAGTEFEVQFPQEPKVTTQYVAGVGSISTAVGGRRGDVNSSYVLVAEAMPVDMSSYGAIDRAEFLLERARQYAEFNGIQHAEYKVEESKLGNVVTFRGGKAAGGVQVLYSCKIVMGKKSFLMLRAGGSAASFPQPGVLEFLASVRKK